MTKGITTHCKRGHEANEANVYVNPNGVRYCRVCKSMRERSSRATGKRLIQYATASSRPTPEMIADAERRANAPRDLTAMIFGDPPKGRSALDGRGTC